MNTRRTPLFCDYDSAEILPSSGRMMNGQRTNRRVAMQDGKSR